MDTERTWLDHETGELHAVIRIDPDWRAYLRFGGPPAHPLVSVQVFPHDDTDPPDIIESGGWWGDFSAAPPRGFAVRKLKAISVDRVRQDAIDHWRDVLETVREHTSLPWADSPWAPLLEQLPAREDLTQEEWLALVAATYVQALASGISPSRAIAERFGITPAQAAQAVWKARNVKRLLTHAPGQGRPGGALTKRARTVLERLERRQPKKEGPRA